MTTPKPSARTPAQRRADLRARAVTLLMDNNETALLQAADSLVIEAMLHSYRRKLPHDFKALSAELLRRLQAARVTVTHTPEPIEEEVEPVTVTVTQTEEVEPVTVTVTQIEEVEPTEHEGVTRDRAIITMHKAGESKRGIARAIGCSEGTVRNVIKRLQTETSD